MKLVSSNSAPVDVGDCECSEHLEERQPILNTASVYTLPIVHGKARFNNYHHACA